jgi:hypothetical protein
MSLLDYLASQATGQLTTPAPIANVMGNLLLASLLPPTAAQQVPAQIQPLLPGSSQSVAAWTPFVTPTRSPHVESSALGPATIRQQFNGPQPMASFRRQLVQATKG